MTQAFGFLNIDKPGGCTSHDVVQIVRRGTGIKKVGHAGTLDPLASGVLVLCIGPATRLSEYVMAHRKVYRANVRLGQVTTTYDAEGAITAQDDTPVQREEIKALLPRFTGEIAQIPPMYSAIKQGGEKLYEKARRGEEVERKARQITIYDLEIDDFAYPDLTLTVGCSPGTYIRSLAHDLGEALGVGAHLAGLRRLASGEAFRIENAVALEALEKDMTAGSWQHHLLDAAAALGEMPRVVLNNHQETAVRQGRFVRLGVGNNGPLQAWSDEGIFIGILTRRAPEEDDTIWKPAKVFNL